MREVQLARQEELRSHCGKSTMIARSADPASSSQRLGGPGPARGSEMGCYD